MLEVLKEYKVGTIELGLQSYSDTVLELSKRGHTSLDEYRACKLIIDAGFDLVGQMMIGLPGSTVDDEIATANFIVSTGAKGARIYPTVVFKETELFEMVEAGEYMPLAFDDAIIRSSKVLDIFEKANVDIIRIGLCSQDNLYDPEKYYAGPNHPALGEYVISELIYNRICEKLFKMEDLGNVLLLTVAKGMYSKTVGQKRRNADRLISEFGFSEIRIKESEELSNYEFEVKIERK